MVEAWDCSHQLLHAEKNFHLRKLKINVTRTKHIAVCPSIPSELVELGNYKGHRKFKFGEHFSRATRVFRGAISLSRVKVVRPNDVDDDLANILPQKSHMSTTCSVKKVNGA